MSRIKLLQRQGHEVVSFLWSVMAIVLGLVLGLVAAWDIRLAAIVGLGSVALAGGALLLQRPFWAFLALIASLPVQVGWELGNGAEITPQLLLLTLLLLVLLIMAGRRQNGRLFHTPFWPLWLIYMFLTTLAILRGPLIKAPVQGIWAFYRLVWTAPLVYPLTWILLSRPALIRRAISWLAGASAIASLIAVAQTLSQGRILSGLTTNFRYLGFLHPLSSEIVAAYSLNPLNKLYVPGAAIFRGHGTFIEHNGFGVFLSVVFFLTWGILAEAGSSQRKWLILALMLQLGGVIVTFSRSAWAAVFLGVGWLFIWHWRHILSRRRALINVAGIGMILILITAVALWQAPQLVSRFTTIFSPGEVSEFNWRVLLWQYARTQIIQHPLLGVGTSMIDRELAGIPGTASQYSSHNLLVDIAYQNGLPALLIFIFFWLLFFFNASRLLRRYRTPDIHPTLVLGIGTAGIAYLVSGVGTPSMSYYNLAILFWFLLGLMLSLGAYAVEFKRRQTNSVPLKQ